MITQWILLDTDFLEPITHWYEWSIQVFHGADSDVIWLQRDFNIFVRNIFDTCECFIYMDVVWTVILSLFIPRALRLRFYHLNWLRGYISISFSYVNYKCSIDVLFSSCDEEGSGLDEVQSCRSRREILWWTSTAEGISAGRLENTVVHLLYIDGSDD